MKIAVDKGIKSFEKIITSINGFDEIEFRIPSNTRDN
jgi:hypothetical protein